MTVWTDQCPTQYRCCQNFRNVAESGKKRDGVRVHKFGAKYRFKGPWDAFGKHIKQAIGHLELCDDRCSNAFDCYWHLQNEFGKEQVPESMNKLLHYEETGNR